MRAGVGAIVFDWERHIPFVPWTIVPYWSIDLLYGISLFLFATRRELDTHARRLLAAQIIAVLCFLLFPLRFSFERGAADGPFSWMFDALAVFDRPFNQAPSLHIALLVILWVAYLRVLPRAWHGVVHVVAVLIAASTLTTWQHHFIDLPTGLWLGWLCVWLFPDDAPSPLGRASLTREPVRRRLASIYAIAALAVGIFAVGTGGAWLWLLWLSGSLILVAAIYAALDAAAFQKRADGSIAAASLWLLAPYLIGAWLNSRWWTRALAHADAVAPGVFLGRMPTGRERARQYETKRLAAIVDVTAELPCPAGGTRYASAPMLDLIAPRSEQIEQASAAIEEARKCGPVLVCCALGFSRSALAVAAWLLRTRVTDSLEEAVAQVRRARPGVVLGPAHLAALQDWQRRHLKPV